MEQRENTRMAASTCVDSERGPEDGGESAAVRSDRGEKRDGKVGTGGARETGAARGARDPHDAERGVNVLHAVAAAVRAVPRVPGAGAAACTANRLRAHGQIKGGLTNF